MIFLVVYYFSPEVFAISDIISPFFSFIYKVINNYIEKKNINTFNLVMNISGYLIIILASFIYNEIIVCNFWGLNENTLENIVQKAYEDKYYDDIDCCDIEDDLKTERTTSNSSSSNGKMELMINDDIKN